MIVNGVEDKLTDFDNKSLNGLGLVDHENIGADFLEENGISKVCIFFGKKSCNCQTLSYY